MNRVNKKDVLGIILEMAETVKRSNMLNGRLQNYNSG